MTIVATQCLWISFLLVQVIIKKESIVTPLALLSAFGVLVLSQDFQFDVLYFIICCTVGFLIELFLIRIGHQQFTHSILPMPIWLPVVWGIGGLSIIRLAEWLVPQGLWLFILAGGVYGLVIEIMIGKIGRTQHWENDKFFGVPFWLPLVWVPGFLIFWWTAQLLQSVVS